jgi:hypothetical protein
MPVTASSSPSSRREWWGWRRVGLRWGDRGGERVAKASGVTGGDGGDNAGILDLSNEEPNMNGARNCV